MLSCVPATTHTITRRKTCTCERFMDYGTSMLHDRSRDQTKAGERATAKGRVSVRKHNCTSHRLRSAHGENCGVGRWALLRLRVACVGQWLAEQQSGPRSE